MTTIDHETLQHRYAEERDKRLRADGNDQYRELTGEFADLAADPYVERADREPLTDETLVAFIGGGFAGLVTGAKLKMAGVDDVRLIEKGGDVGGTWYWNRYPGAQCDTAAMIYLPLLEETGHTPSLKYTYGPEILDHSQRIADTFGLYDRAVLQTEVTDVVWDDTTSQWVIHTDRGDEMRARYLCMGTGPLHKPKLPGIDGIESFSGHRFHTSRWDYDYTGGSPDGDPMDRLTDQRVAIIGTGATAVQCVPHLARAAGDLFVFQRTPSSVDARHNQPIDPDWFETLEPGWQTTWLENFVLHQQGGAGEDEPDLVDDGWTEISQRIRSRLMQLAEAGADVSDLATLFREAYVLADDDKMEAIRARVDELVEDERTAEGLKPWYRQLCKRPCFHDEYLQSFNRSNTHLIDTNGQGVERIDETGLWANGQHYEVDCIIFATGFEVGTPFHRRSGFDPKGREFRLSEAWTEGMESLHGMHVAGFPNLFIVSFQQAANLISNVPHNLVEAGETLATIISHAESVGAREVEATPEGQQAWMDLIGPRELSLLGDTSCTPGYYNNEGAGIDEAAAKAGYAHPGGALGFFAHIKEWRTNGRFDGLRIE